MPDKDWQHIEVPQDIKLIVADMDGTLLDAHSAIPQDFWALLDKLDARGITFVPASGRQLHTLELMFAKHSDTMSIIAENGNVVVDHGDVIEVHGIDNDIATRVIDLVESASATHNIGLVVCGLMSAYVNRTDDPFIEECSKYYKRLMVLDDLHEVVESEGDTILKLAIFDFDDAESMAHELFHDLYDDYAVVVSGAHWVDIMDKHADKSRGVVALQKTLGVSPDQTAAFGDYLNDVGMLEHATFSFAMANAHEQVKEVANFEAPANTENGVVRVVERLVG